MTQIICKVTKTYQLITATCNVLYNINWVDNYTLHKITDQDIQYIGQARNLHKYLHLWTFKTPTIVIFRILHFIVSIIHIFVI